MSHVIPLSDDACTAGAVLALHSSGASGRQWHAYAQALPRAVVVHAPDLLGYGADAAWPAGAMLSLDDEVQPLAALLFAQSSPVHLVGHSYGGAVALQLALRWPERVRSLTLYEPARVALLRWGANDHWREVRSVGNEIIRQVRAGAHAVAARLFVDYWDQVGSFAALPNPARRHIVERMDKVRAEFEALSADTTPIADFAALRMPLRLLAGTRSPAPAQRVAELLASICPGAQLVRLPGAGHLAPIQEPARVLPRLPFGDPVRRPLAA